MRTMRQRTVLADHDPRPVALGDVMLLAKLAARASARSDWALEPGLLRANCFMSVPHTARQAADSGPGRAAADTAIRSTRARAVSTGNPIVAANRSASRSRYFASAFSGRRACAPAGGGGDCGQTIRAWAAAMCSTLAGGPTAICLAARPPPRGKMPPEGVLLTPRVHNDHCMSEQ
jgi:hypothetical protein